MRTTAVAHTRASASLWHVLDEPAEHVGVGLREDAVAEVEDVARAGRAAASSIARRAPDPLPRPEQDAPGRGCPARRFSPTAAQPSSSGIRQSRPITSPPAARHQRRAASRCRCRSGSSGRRPRRGSAPTRARRTPRSPPARARRPTSRRAGSRPRPPAPVACDVRGERVGELLHQRVPRLRLGYISAFTRRNSRLGLPSMR